jgi:hypothetical protein
MMMLLQDDAADHGVFLDDALMWMQKKNNKYRK